MCIERKIKRLETCISGKKTCVIHQKTDGCQTYKPIRGFNPFSKSRHFWHLITNFKLFLLTILTCCCHKTYYNMVNGSRSYSSLHKDFELYFTGIKSPEIPNFMHYIIFQRHINITTMFDTGHLTRNNNIWVHEIDFVCPLIGKSNIQSSFPCYINFCFIENRQLNVYTHDGRKGLVRKVQENVLKSRCNFQCDAFNRHPL